MHPLIRAAERAQPALDALHKPKREAALLFAGAPAGGAVGADPGQHRVNPIFHAGRHFIRVRLWCCRIQFAAAAANGQEG